MSPSVAGAAPGSPSTLPDRNLLGATALFVLLLLGSTVRSADFLGPSRLHLLPVLLLLLGFLAAAACRFGRFLLHREPAALGPRDGLPVLLTVAVSGAAVLARAGFVELRLVVRQAATAGAATAQSQLVEGLLRTSFVSVVVVLVTLLIALGWLALAAPRSRLALGEAGTPPGALR